jgi:septum site-determining protein MinC
VRSLAERAPDAAVAPAPVRIRGRSLMALVVTPEFPMADWFAGLDAQMRVSGLLLDRPVLVDLSVVLEAGGPDAAAIVLEGLEARGLRLVGVEGVPSGALAATRWEPLARTHGSGRQLRDLPEIPGLPGARPTAASAGPPAEPRLAAPCLTLDRPVRSGESVVFDEGDITIIGAVASGADVIAGGSIHIYGALRGRAIAGVRTGEAARIFCRRLEAEMVGVGKYYRTAEGWGAGLQGRAVQVWCDRGALRLSAFD